LAFEDPRPEAAVVDDDDGKRVFVQSDDGSVQKARGE